MRVFYTSPWIPPEWIKAHGLEPRGVWQAEKLRLGGSPLAAGVCAFAEAIQRMTTDETDDVVVFTTSCDQMRRSYDAMPPIDRRRAFLFNIPATWQAPAAGEIYRAELERLGRFLRAVGGRAPSLESLKQELAQRGRVRRQLIEAAPTCPATVFADAVAQFHWDGSFHCVVTETPASAASGVPLALIGGPLCRGQKHLLNTIEAAGGRVVLNATEAGERSLGSEINGEEPGASPVDLLVKAYLGNLVDAFQRPNTPLYAWLGSRLAERKVRGIVLWTYTGCDLWRAEARTLRERCGLPVLLLEADEAQQNSPRQTGRIEAFLETLQ